MYRTSWYSLNIILYKRWQLNFDKDIAGGTLSLSDDKTQKEGRYVHLYKASINRQNVQLFIFTWFTKWAPTYYFLTEEQITMKIYVLTAAPILHYCIIYQQENKVRLLLDKMLLQKCTLVSNILHILVKLIQLLSKYALVHD